MTSTAPFAGDNLGDHTATQTLDLVGQRIHQLGAALHGIYDRNSNQHTGSLEWVGSGNDIYLYINDLRLGAMKTSSLPFESKVI